MRNQRRTPYTVTFGRDDDAACSVDLAVFEPGEFQAGGSLAQAGAVRVGSFNIPGHHHLLDGDPLIANGATWYVVGGSTIWLDRTNVPVARSVGRQTIARLRAATGTNGYSERQVLDWNLPPASTLPITGCFVQPGPAQPELLDDRDAITTLYTVWAPADADVTELDRVVYNGTTYDADGTIQRWDFGPGHLVIPLKAVAG